ncbi:hypothetical protein LSCM1_03427 [Leishmania martiniquensis]|uniref:Uncharacterized protein n=1 Tax=Leishmania martiniquensis TaxID=1580590 RepID=A0A836GMP3_9TRYP|nr:hypothetical protein LSCM1_03427 [Leishmania martiniquensis]
MPRQSTRRSSPGPNRHREESVADVSQSPTCASASSSLGGVDEAGVFLLLNGLVCRTADASGRFRPADIFSGVDREAATADPEMPSTSIHFHLPISSEEAKFSVDSDCPLFNCFGVLSGGVIIDPIDESFVEFTDSAVYTPITAAAAADGNGIPDDPARRRLQEANERAFRAGETVHIRPECPLTVCCSELPLPPVCSDSSVKLFQHRSSSFTTTGGAGPAVTSPRHAAVLGMENVEKWLCRLAQLPGDTQKPRRRQAWVAVWADAEELRLCMRAHRDVHASDSSLYLPPRIPFPQRFRGQPIFRAEGAESECPTASQRTPMPTPPDRDANSTAAVPPDGVRCAAASFTCYTGVPRFAVATDSVPRSDSAEFVKGAAFTRLRKRLRPWAGTAPRRRRRDSSSSDEEESFLIPFSGATPRQAAFSLFVLYFNHLGLLCNGVRITGETEATSCGKGLGGSAVSWALCPRHLYNVRAEVERKRRVTKELRENPERMFPGGTRWSTTPSNRDTVAAAWTALLLSSRTALLERIAEVNRHIHEIHSEKQQQRQL